MSTSSSSSATTRSPLNSRLSLTGRSPKCIREQYLRKLGYTPLLFENDSLIPTTLASRRLFGGNDDSLDEKQKLLVFETSRDTITRSSLSSSKSREWLIPPPGSIRGSVFNLAGATLGAGALSLPYAVAVSGIGFALLQLAVAGALTIYTIRLLIRAGEMTGLKSYEDLAVYCFGKRIALFVELNILIFCFGISIAYLVTLGDILTPLGVVLFGTKSIFATRWVLMSIFCTTIMFPLSLLRDISSLQFSSILGVLSILFLVGAVTTRAAMIVATDGVPSDLSYGVNLSSGMNFMLSVPIVMFAFTCQVNVFSIYTELQRPGIRRMKKVVDRATLISILVYTTIGIMAYLAFGKTLLDPEKKGNILLSFDVNDTLIAISRAAITFTVAVAFPLNIFPCRFTLEMMFFSNALPSTSRHVIITSSLVFSALLLAIFCPSINVIFGIIGGTCSSVVCFCLPAAYMLKILNGPVTSREKIGPLLLFIGAIIIGSASTAITIYTNFFKT